MKLNKCLVSKYCGGCNYQNIEYEKQIEMKQQLIDSQLGVFKKPNYILYSNNNLLSIAGGVGMGGLVYLFSNISNEKIGKGDALLVSFIGSVCGLRFSIVMLLLSFIVSSVTALVLLVMKKATKNTEMPFAPFLSIGVLAGGLI